MNSGVKGAEIAEILLNYLWTPFAKTKSRTAMAHAAPAKFK
jgi:hypothetical protein